MSSEYSHTATLTRVAPTGVYVDAPRYATQGAPAIRSLLYVGIAVAANRVRAVPAACMAPLASAHAASAKVS